jgi:hypothetical protein
MNRGEPGKTSSVVGGFPQAVYADVRGLLSRHSPKGDGEGYRIFLFHRVAVVPLYGRALVRAVARA